MKGVMFGCMRCFGDWVGRGDDWLGWKAEREGEQVVVVIIVRGFGDKGKVLRVLGWKESELIVLKWCCLGWARYGRRWGQLVRKILCWF